MDKVLTKTGRLNSNVEVSKFTVLLLNVSTYKDGVEVPSGANTGPIAGVAEESILPNGFNDYSAGVLQVVSGTAWPANAIPSSALGRGIAYTCEGIIRCVAAGVIAAGDDVNIADNQGRIKTVSEIAGTTIYVVGEAQDAAGQAGDIIRVRLQILKRTA